MLPEVAANGTGPIKSESLGRGRTLSPALVAPSLVVDFGHPFVPDVGHGEELRPVRGQSDDVSAALGVPIEGAGLGSQLPLALRLGREEA